MDKQKTHAVLAIAVLVIGIPLGIALMMALGAGAQIAGHGDSGQDCVQETLIGLLGVTSAGNIEACFQYPRNVLTATSAFDLSVFLSAPAATGAGTATLTTTWTLTGCSAGTQTNGGPGGNGFGTQFYSRLAVTMTSAQCRVVVEPVYKNGAGTTLFDYPFTTVILTLDAPTATTISGTLDTQTRLCDASAFAAACNNPEIENQNRLCDASAFAAACNNPEFDNQNRLCDASTFTATCNNPEVDNLNRQCAASALGSACTTPMITLRFCNSATDAGTDALTCVLHTCSQAQNNAYALNAVCNGAGETNINGTFLATITPCSTAALGVDPHACDTHLCGPTPGITCNNVELNDHNCDHGTCNDNSLTATFNKWAPVLAIILLVVWAEATRNLYVYVLTAICVGIIVPLLWSEVLVLRLLFIAVGVLMAMRAFDTFKGTDEDEGDT